MPAPAEIPGPPEPDYDSNGVDRTLIRASLKETPLECLEALEEMLELAESVRGASEQVPPVD